MVTNPRRAPRLLQGRAKDAVLLPAVAIVCVTPYVLGAMLPADAFTHPQPDGFDERFTTAPWTAALPLASIALLLWRRRYPRAVLTAVVAVAIIGAIVTGEPGVNAIPVMMALFNLALRTDRRTWLVAAAGSTVVLALPAFIIEPNTWPRVFGIVFWIALPPAIAEAVRNRHAYLAEVEERARRAERTKEEEARRQVAEERIRIARELHDILAHSIAVVNVQSGAAAHVIEHDVAQAKQALVHINDASDAALVELRTMLDVLRQDGDPQAPTTPMPTLRDLDDLLTAPQTSGLAVDTEVTGDVDALPAEVSVVGYRVLQEALTNVLKHAAANRVCVIVEVAENAVRLEVLDDGAGSADPPDEGHGRVGMRERVHAVGGTLDDGPLASGGYHVAARVPLPVGGAR